MKLVEEEEKNNFQIQEETVKVCVGPASRSSQQLTVQ